MAGFVVWLETLRISKTMKERFVTAEVWILHKMLRISWTEKKSNLEVLRAY